MLEEWIASPGKWHPIHPGKAKNHEGHPVLHPSSSISRYPQGNLPNCMVASFASCLHYMGMTREAEDLVGHIGQLYTSKFIFDLFHKIVVEACGSGFTLICSRKFKFDQDESLFEMPTLVILTEKENECSDHAITVFKDMIFNSLHENILQRCQKTLDWCCEPHGFQKIYCAYSLAKADNKNKRLKIK